MDDLSYLCPDYYKIILDVFYNGNTHAVFDCSKCNRNCNIESYDDTLCIYDFVDESWFIEE